MAENDVPNQLEDEDERPLVVPSHNPLPPPPEVHYTRPILGQKSSPSPGLSSGSSDGWNDPAAAANHGAGLAAGLTFVTGIVGGAMLGNWIDGRWGHPGAMPWATLILTVVGAAVGFVNLQRLSARANRNIKK